MGPCGDRNTRLVGGIFQGIRAPWLSIGIESAAAIGDVNGWLTPDTPLQARIRALTFATDHQRLDVIDQLVRHDTPVDAVDEMISRHALRLAAQHGRPRSVQRLLSHDANPQLTDEHGHTALDLCQPGHRYLENPGHDEVDTILRTITKPPDSGTA